MLEVFVLEFFKVVFQDIYFLLEVVNCSLSVFQIFNYFNVFAAHVFGKRLALDELLLVFLSQFLQQVVLFILIPLFLTAVERQVSQQFAVLLLQLCHLQKQLFIILVPHHALHLLDHIAYLLPELLFLLTLLFYLLLISITLLMQFLILDTQTLQLLCLFIELVH